MMDPLISALNQQVTNKISGNQIASNPAPGATQFADVLKTKQSDVVMDKLMDNIIGGSGSEPKVASAESIQINRLDHDVEHTTNFSPKQKIGELFANINQDMGNMDSLIEVLSDPNSKLSRQELLGCEFFMHKATMTIEMGSKGLQMLSQNLNTVLNTNVG